MNNFNGKQFLNGKLKNVSFLEPFIWIVYHSLKGRPMLMALKVMAVTKSNLFHLFDNVECLSSHTMQKQKWHKHKEHHS